MKRTYWKNVLVAIDCLIGAVGGINATNGLFGFRNCETISSFVGRNYHGRWPERAINWFFLMVMGERDHCLNNIENDYVEQP